MYTITKSTPSNSSTPMLFPKRSHAMSVLDEIREYALKTGNEVNYSSLMGKDVRLTVGDDITYILRKE